MTGSAERPSAQFHRPDPARWVWYAFGGKLGPRYREWVLHDVTARTWWVRHISRSLVQLVPVAALLLIVLGPGPITWGAILGGLFMAMIYSAAYIEETAEHRLLKHGFPSGTGKRVRAERDPVANADRVRRYNEAYRTPGPTGPADPADPLREDEPTG